MAAQPQPIYPDELNAALDRFGARIVAIIDARVDGLTLHLRGDRQKAIDHADEIAQASIQRDQDLANLLLAFREESRKQIETLREESRKQTEMLLAHINALHGEAMEAINEVRNTTVKLQQAIDDLRQGRSE